MTQQQDRAIATLDFAPFAQVCEAVRKAMTELGRLGVPCGRRARDLAKHCGCLLCAQRCNRCADMVKMR